MVDLPGIIRHPKLSNRFVAGVQSLECVPKFWSRDPLTISKYRISWGHQTWWCQQIHIKWRGPCTHPITYCAWGLVGGWWKNHGLGWIRLHHRGLARWRMWRQDKPRMPKIKILWGSGRDWKRKSFGPRKNQKNETRALGLHNQLDQPNQKPRLATARTNWTMTSSYGCHPMRMWAWMVGARGWQVKR